VPVKTILKPSQAALAVALFFCLATVVFAGTTAVDLRCNYAVNPLGVDSANPRLFWKMESNVRGQRQIAYQILAASLGKNLAHDNGDLWDSGKVSSDETIQISYAGAVLKSSQQVFWKVRVWDKDGKVSAWSKPATWTMGVLNDADWQAKWIGAADTNIPSLLLRREFTVKPGLRRALANVCGLGQYELTLNGKKAGDDFLSPGWTKYDKTCLYDTRDITDLLRNGKNAVGIELGDGMYNVPATRFKPPGYQPYTFGPLKAIAQIRLEYADGLVETIGTDENWRVAPGPITTSSVYGGEDFDARLVQHGWDRINFNDSKWSSATVVNGPGGELRGLSCSAPPIRFFEIHKPVSSRTFTNGDMIFDLGQNAAHVPRISVTGPPGSWVRVIPSELVNTNGSADQSSMGTGRRSAIWCDYTKATDGVETWTPEFFYIGCRYLEVKFYPAKGETELPVVKSIEGIVVQSSSEPVGEFECSNTLFNRIHKLVRWAQRSNMMSVMTDCPQREKRGWLEEDHLNGPALRYEFDLAQLFTKSLNDIADSQLTNGLVPTTAPEYTVFRDKGQTGGQRNRFGDSPEWGAAFILVPWQQYEFDGDLNLFRLHYDAMINYLAYLGSRASNNIVDYGLGDWCDVGPKPPGIAQLTPIALTATAFYFHDVEIMSRVAALLGKDDDTRRFSELAENIRAAFNEKFYNVASHFYATDSQCANSIPFVMGICESTNRAAVMGAIVADVRAHGLTAGDVGYRYLLRALADGGRSDVIFDINNQSDKPGYGYQLNHGATSLVETWDARRNVSQNHFMLGQIQEWFYHDLAGIGCDPAGPGFKKIIIKPQPVGDVTWAKASYNSIRGKIVSDWKRDGKRFTLHVTIPANTSATVFVPLKSAAVVPKTEGATFLRMENDRAVFAIGSGDYTFISSQ